MPRCVDCHYWKDAECSAPLPQWCVRMAIGDQRGQIDPEEQHRCPLFLGAADAFEKSKPKPRSK